LELGPKGEKKESRGFQTEQGILRPLKEDREKRKSDGGDMNQLPHRKAQVKKMNGKARRQWANGQILPSRNR